MNWKHTVTSKVIDDYDYQELSVQEKKYYIKTADPVTDDDDDDLSIGNLFSVEQDDLPSSFTVPDNDDPKEEFQGFGGGSSGGGGATDSWEESSDDDDSSDDSDD